MLRRLNKLLLKYGRVALYIGAAIYLLALYAKISSIQQSLATIRAYTSEIDTHTGDAASDVSVVYGEVSAIGSGDCQNARICR